jgi:hypothetical protein
VQSGGVRVRAATSRLDRQLLGHGGPPSTELPAVEIVEGQTVTITVINDAAGVSAENVTSGATGVQPRFTG